MSDKKNIIFYRYSSFLLLLMFIRLDKLMIQSNSDSLTELYVLYLKLLYLT